MRGMMSAVVACGLTAGLAAAQEVKPVQPPKVVVPIQPLPARPATQVTALKMAQLEEEFETVEAQRDVKKAYVKAAQVGVHVAEVKLNQVDQLAQQNPPVVSKREVELAKLEVEQAKAQLEIRLAELKESEVKVKHAKKRLDDAKLAGVRPAPGVRPVPVDPPPPPNAAELKAELAAVQAAAEKLTVPELRAAADLTAAQERLAWSQRMVKQGYLSAAQMSVEEAKAAAVKEQSAKIMKERKALDDEVARLKEKLKKISEK